MRLTFVSTLVTLIVILTGDNVNRPGKRRFHLDLPEKMYEDIKLMAEARNIRATGWIIQAIIEKIIREKRYE